MGRSGNSFGRAKPRFKTTATVLIICEDTQAGKKYLEDAKRSFNVDADVEVAHVGHTDPRGIVNQALSMQDNYDMVYCVIDRDTHETFDEAVELAKTSKKIELIVSYPCFEFWLFIHFEFSRRAYVTTGKDSPGAQMLRDLKKCAGMGGYDKSKGLNVFALLNEKLPKARERAEKILKDAETVGELNPSTMMHELYDSFEVLSKTR